MIWLDTRSGDRVNASQIISTGVVKHGDNYYIEARTNAGTFSLVTDDGSDWKEHAEAQKAMIDQQEHLRIVSRS